MNRIPRQAFVLAAVFAVAGFVGLVHDLPHLPGPAPDGPTDAWAQLADRAWDAARFHDRPYPLHVDELYHWTYLAQIEREGAVEPMDPYTQANPVGDLFSVSGMRSERGWQVALVQFHDLTGLSFPAMFRLLPAAWTAYLSVLVWATLRPAPGALASAAFVAIVPTTVRFLGPGFLVPSAFALPWPVAAVLLVARARGPGRFLGIVLTVTGAFFMHLVLGVVTLAAALFAILVASEDWRDRAGLAVATLLPLAWIVPPNWEDARRAVASAHTLPFEAGVFLTAGLPILAAAAAGVFTAWWRRGTETAPHRAFSFLVAATAFSMAWSIQADHRNDATYSRLVPTFFLGLAVLAGLGIGWAAGAARRLPGTGRWRSVVPVAVGLLLAALAVQSPVAAHLATPYYRVFDETSWDAAQDLRDAGIGKDDVFLSHPWRAPAYNAVTGARPWTVLFPGAPPEKGEDYVAYLRGADTGGFYEERGITVVVGPRPPSVPHVALGPDAYRISRTAAS